MRPISNYWVCLVKQVKAAGWMTGVDCRNFAEGFQ